MSSKSSYSPKEIIEIFSYTEDEQDAFEYLRKYMKLIKPKLPIIENDAGKLRRFALTGLFLAYRASNHSGSDFTTEIGSVDSENRFVERINTAKEYFDIKFLNSTEYLKLIDFSMIDLFLVAFRLKSLPKKFYRFVMK